MNELPNHKIKYVCRLENQTFHQELYLNQVLQQSPPDFPEISSSQKFFEAFQPEILLKNLASREKNAVLVFRTDSHQMQTFTEFLHGNFTESP